MKKRILTLGTILGITSLSAFSFVNCSNKNCNSVEPTCNTTEQSSQTPNFEPEVLYEVGSRFDHTINKEDLMSASSVYDIFPENVTREIESFYDVQVGLLTENGELVEHGESQILNEAQLGLLRTADYSTNFFVRGLYKNLDNGKEEYMVYYTTVVPSQSAEHRDGIESFVSYIREQTKSEASTVNQKKLEPGKVAFSISKTGEVTNLSLLSTSGYCSLDLKTMEAIQASAEKWLPAKNSQGQEVEQDLIFFFGVKGC